MISLSEGLDEGLADRDLLDDGLALRHDLLGLDDGAAARQHARLADSGLIACSVQPWINNIECAICAL